MAAKKEVRSLTVEPGGMSPHEALLKIRAAKKAGDKAQWNVIVRKGFYVLPESLTLLPEDSGTPEAPVYWIGEGEGCVFSGGAEITGWTNEGKGVWSADLPRGKDGAPLFFEELWVNGRRAQRARLPHAGFCHLKTPESKQVKRGGKTCFAETAFLTGKEAAVLGKLSKKELGDVQMCVVKSWSFARRILRGFDAKTGRIETHSPVTWTQWQQWTEEGALVCFENVRGAFTQAGEWFYDRAAGKVKYRPIKGEKMAGLRVVAPTAKLSRLVDIAGEPEKGKYVHDIHFSGISFEFTDAKTYPTGVILAAKAEVAADANGPTESWQYQAAQGYDGAVTANGACRITWDGCTVRHTANYAFRFNDGCSAVRIDNSLLEDLGAGGVWIGARKGTVAAEDGDGVRRRVYTKRSPLSTYDNHVTNCVIREGGRFNPEGTGVAITHASDCTVRHCDIYDFYYTGVSVGWTWGFAGSVAQRNEIAFNRIYDLGKGVMSDMGGVYTLGTSYGTKVHDNVIHDVRSYAYGGWALYTDEGSEGIVMERNLCWNTTDGGFHQHYGTGCIIRNNIFAWNRTLGAVRMYRDCVQDIPCTLNFVNNIVLVREGPLAGLGVRNVGGVWANNLWWDVSGKAELDGLGWDEWKVCGKETNGQLADPLFYDADNFDFRLKAKSPAFKLGFQAWDYSRAGAGKIDVPWPAKAICLEAPRPESLKRFCAFIRNRLAKDGFGTIVLRTNYRYAFASHPECRDSAALSAADVKAILAVCRACGIKLIPKINLFGHQGGRNGVVGGGLLKAYPDMDESRGKATVRENYCRSICPKHPKALAYATDLAVELAEVFESDKVHLGCDEVFEIGSCERCKDTLTAQLFSDWVNGLSRGLAKRGVASMIWGDRLIDSAQAEGDIWDASDNGTAAAIQTLDRDIVICDWRYWVRDNGYPSVGIFADAGFKIWLCPWCNAAAARRYIDYAARHDKGHILGVMLTTWYGADEIMDAIEGKSVDRLSATAQTHVKGVAEVYKLFCE